MILDRTTESSDPKAQPVFDGHRISELSRLARRIPISDEIRRYGVCSCRRSSRLHPEHQAWAVRPLWLSPRSAQALILGAKIRKAISINYIAFDDLRACHPPLRHRLILNFEGQAENVQPDEIIDDIPVCNT